MLLRKVMLAFLGMWHFLVVQPLSVGLRCQSLWSVAVFFRFRFTARFGPMLAARLKLNVPQKSLSQTTQETCLIARHVTMSTYMGSMTLF